MIHYSRVIQGIARYIDNELVAAFTGSWKAWVLGGAAGIAMAKAEQIFGALKGNAILAALNVIEGDNINVDVIVAELRKQAQKGTATATLPVIGPVTFSAADVEKLYQYIRG